MRTWNLPVIRCRCMKNEIATEPHTIITRIKMIDRNFHLHFVINPNKRHPEFQNKNKICYFPVDFKISAKCQFKFMYTYNKKYIICYCTYAMRETSF